MTILEIQKKYSTKVDRFDLDLILEDVLKKPRSFILAHPEYKIPKLKIDNCKLKIARRAKGEPLAYILGHKGFYGLDFIVNKNVLIPRPETELMIEEALKLDDNKTAFIDIGTGSGCIILSIAKTITNGRNPNSKFIGIDISSKALAVTRKNARRHGLEKIVKFIKGDLLSPLLKKNNSEIRNRNLVILANLPYVESGWKKSLATDSTRGLKYEPSIALYSGKDGLDHYRRLSTQLIELKKMTDKPITVYCEIGDKQANEMRRIFSWAKKIDIKKDHNCRYRLTIINI